MHTHKYIFFSQLIEKEDPSQYQGLWKKKTSCVFFFCMSNPICGVVLKELLEDEGFQKLID